MSTDVANKNTLEKKKSELKKDCNASMNIIVIRSREGAISHFL
jgi:hypothetical protein